MSNFINPILNGVNSLFNQRLTAPEVPSALRQGASLRPGMSPMFTATRIINRLADAGFKVDRFSTESQNLLTQLVIIITEEILKEITENARVEATGAPGTSRTLGSGANAGGAFTVESFSTNFPNVIGYIH